MKRKRTHKNCRFGKKVRKDNKKYIAYNNITCTNPDACKYWIDTSHGCYLHKFNYIKVKTK